jgi:uncharacterized membrane protein
MCMAHAFSWSGYLLGFALGGFFDGILLHQILQWHHLLSGLEGDAFQDIRVQILADGLFHALMYVVAAIGLVLLFRAWRDHVDDKAGRLLLANAFIGFGVWHIVDAVLSHWLAGIHRIRMNADNPLVWDLIWFVAFGLLPLIAGVLIRRGTVHLRSRPVASVLAAGVITGGIWSALPPPNVSQVMVYFGPGARPDAVLNAAAVLNARVIWADRSGKIWAFDMEDPGTAQLFYRHGALFVGNSFFPLGCLAFSRAT